MRCFNSSAMQAFSVTVLFCATADNSGLPTCNAEASLRHDFKLSWPQATKLSMWTSNSSQVMTPGVESGATNLGHCEHLGKAPTSLHMSSQMLANLFCTCIRWVKSAAAHDCWVDELFWVCNADACCLQLFNLSWPQATKLSMCVSNSSQVMTPGVESGATNLGHCAHLGKAPTSLHISSQMPASLFWNAMRCFNSSAMQAFSVTVLFCATADNSGLPTCNAEASLRHDFKLSWPQATKLSMWTSNSSQVMTPGVESGATNLGHCEHLGKAPTSLHMSSQMLANLFCTCIRWVKSAAAHDCWVDELFWVCNADACCLQLFNLSWPQATKLSMCVSNSSQVMTPGVESGATKSGHWEHLGKAPTSLHMSSQMPANLFWNCTRFFKSSAMQARSVTSLF